MLRRIFRKLTYIMTGIVYPVLKVKMHRKYPGLKQVKGMRISTSTFIDHPSKLFLGENVYIGHHCFIEASNGISVGEGCQITNFVNITTHSTHNAIRYNGSRISEKQPVGYIKGAVTIGKYSFIGPFSTIMPSTTIGKGSIVAAYSYVKGGFPDFSIIKGNPAVVVGSTKDKDLNFLENYPELKNAYLAWAENE